MLKRNRERVNHKLACLTHRARWLVTYFNPTYLTLERPSGTAIRITRTEIVESPSQGCDEPTEAEPQSTTPN
nr:hypothetical protein Iba_chr06cCG17030 [Ipomoea batatas]